MANTKTMSHISNAAAPCEEFYQEINIIVFEIVTNILYSNYLCLKFCYETTYYFVI